MSPVISCGVVILNPARELLVCRTTGAGRWDLPKGMLQPRESARDTAVRETWEETSLDLDPQTLVDLGLFDYLPQKRLHLFGIRVGLDAFDIDACGCHSTFVDRNTGAAMSEVDGYAWKPASRWESWCGKNLMRVLGSIEWDRFAAFPELRSAPIKS